MADEVWFCSPALALNHATTHTRSLEAPAHYARCDWVKYDEDGKVVRCVRGSGHESTATGPLKEHSEGKKSPVTIDP